MRRYRVEIGALLMVASIMVFTGVGYADHPINRTPEIQGLVTGTSANVQGTVTETDSGAWVTRDNPYFDFHGFDEPPAYGYGPGELTDPLIGDQAIVTTGYNDNLAAVSGLTVFSKSMAIDTGNQVADGTNLKTLADLQYIATDTGRATRSEDILLDSAANQTDPTEIYALCPFLSDDSIDTYGIPAHCNIVEAGSSIDTTLTSVVTSTGERFIGADSGVPLALDYVIDAKGITAGDQSSPMIGSASAFLKVHTQEARQPNFTVPTEAAYLASWTKKSQDLSYSESSSASGLIGDFNKAMHYQSGLVLI
ncbi:MAG TPA: hypothetical protein VMC42_00715 [Methanoregulaceae archaeon]|nr:hypothetical protein [Methanoregulaceae archaeon]